MATKCAFINSVNHKVNGCEFRFMHNTIEISALLILELKIFVEFVFIMLLTLVLRLNNAIFSSKILKRF